MTETFSAAGFEWVDGTSYQKGEQGRKKPSVWEADIGNTYITLIYSQLNYPNVWIFQYRALQIEYKKLKAITKEEAAVEAVSIIKGRLKELNNFFRM